MYLPNGPYKTYWPNNLCVYSWCLDKSLKHEAFSANMDINKKQGTINQSNQMIPIIIIYYEQNKVEQTNLLLNAKEALGTKAR